MILAADGMFPEMGADTAFRALSSIDAEIVPAKLDLGAVFTNEFVKRATRNTRRVDQRRSLAAASSPTLVPSALPTSPEVR